MAEPIVAPAQAPVAYGPPLKPQKKLAIGLLALFLVWLAVLWVMYFTTVHPHEHVGEAAPETGARETPVMTVPRE